MRNCVGIARNAGGWADPVTTGADVQHGQLLPRRAVVADASKIEPKVLFHAEQYHSIDAAQIFPPADGPGNLVEQVQTLHLCLNFLFRLPPRHDFRFQGPVGGCQLRGSVEDPAL
jgi:hypothetical protein